MKQNVSLDEYLTPLGWVYKGHCRCGGMLTYKYELQTTFGEYKLRVRAQSYLLSKPGTKFIKHPISEFKNQVNEIIKSTAPLV